MNGGHFRLRACVNPHRDPPYDFANKRQTERIIMTRKISALLFATAMFSAASAGSALAMGAIAVDDSYGDEPSGVGYGFVTQLGSVQQASAGAMEACRSEGNTDCKVVFTFQNCGAYAASRNNYGVGTGATITAAEKNALTDCGEAGCIAIVSDCE